MNGVKGVEGGSLPFQDGVENTRRFLVVVDGVDTPRKPWTAADRALLRSRIINLGVAHPPRKPWAAADRALLRSRIVNLDVAHPPGKSNPLAVAVAAVCSAPGARDGGRLARGPKDGPA